MGYPSPDGSLASSQPDEGQAFGRFVISEDSIMDQVLTIESIRRQFESEWVLIDDPQTNDSLEVLGGRVLHHSKDRDEVYRKAVALRPRRSAVIYTGEIPEGTAVVL
jgi:hypothetical protein